MHWLFYVILIFSTTLMTRVGASQDLRPGPDMAVTNRVELRTLDTARHSYSWQEALNNDLISVSQHVIEPDETYSSIIEDNGLRADPISIKVTRELNEDRFSVTALPPGESLFVISASQFTPLAVALDSDLKQNIELRELELHGQSAQLDTWGKEQGSTPDVARTQKIYNDIVTNIQQFRTTGYAVDRPNLQSIDESLNVAKTLFQDIINENRPPSERELNYLSKIHDVIKSINTSASDTDADKINTHILTIIPETKLQRHGLNVCFRDAMAWYKFKWSNPDQEPEWQCTKKFNTLSSPAKKLFAPHLIYVVWATFGTTRVSQFNVIKIERNNNNNFRHELAVSAR